MLNEGVKIGSLISESPIFATSRGTDLHYKIGFRPKVPRVMQ